MLVLSGCSGLPGRTNITSLLSAPKFSQTESDIIKAIDNHIGDNITLRHSTSQGYSAPVQFIDIDGKDEDEAVVFYYAPNKGVACEINATASCSLGFGGQNGCVILKKI